jgi:AcrR family transcriptional regulator
MITSNLSKTPASRPAKDRIFDAAKSLFYQHGIRAVGVEGIAEAAKTTKMSLYRNFESKDHLVAECLRDHKREFWLWWDEVVAPLEGDPKAQLLALIDAFISAECTMESRGCPLANAIIELHEEEHPGRAVVLEHKHEFRRRLRDLCRQMGAHHPEQLGDALMLLIEGAYVCRLTFRDSRGPTEALPGAVRELIDCHLQASAPA